MTTTALREALEQASKALDVLQERASSFSVSGVYFDEPCFTDNVAALKQASDAEGAVNSILAALTAPASTVEGDPPYPKKDPTKPFWLLEHPDGSWLKTRGAFIGGSLDPRGVTFTRDVEQALWWSTEVEAKSTQFTRVIDPVYRILRPTEHSYVTAPASTPAGDDAAEELYRLAYNNLANLKQDHIVNGRPGLFPPHIAMAECLLATVRARRAHRACTPARSEALAALREVREIYRAVLDDPDHAPYGPWNVERVSRDTEYNQIIVLAGCYMTKAHAERFAAMLNSTHADALLGEG